jgi:carboxymethylenebutenolidase
MKKSILFLMMWAVAAVAFAQKDVTVCHTPPTEKFALFASNKSFNREHPNPIAFTHVSLAGGKMIRFSTIDGQDANGYLIEAKTKTDKWLFVFQEWWGLNDHIKKASEMYYNELGNVNVLALDMYDGKIATERETAGKYMQEFKQERGTNIVNGALKYAGKNARIATIGWCFGGGQSMQASLTAGSQAVGCVIYYGMPEDNVERLKGLNCDVLDIYGTKDKWINSDVARKFEDNMKLANKKLQVKSYDADHGFANPSNSVYDKAATEDAHKLSLEFLLARLK